MRGVAFWGAPRLDCGMGQESANEPEATSETTHKLDSRSLLQMGFDSKELPETIQRIVESQKLPVLKT